MGIAKAFDTVSHQHILHDLQHRVADPHVTRLVSNMHENIHTYHHIKTCSENGLSKQIDTIPTLIYLADHKDAKQGSLNPLTYKFNRLSRNGYT